MNSRDYRSDQPRNRTVTRCVSSRCRIWLRELRAIELVGHRKSPCLSDSIRVELLDYCTRLSKTNKHISQSEGKVDLRKNDSSWFLQSEYGLLRLSNCGFGDVRNGRFPMIKVSLIACYLDWISKNSLYLEVCNISSKRYVLLIGKHVFTQLSVNLNPKEGRKVNGG